MAAKIEDFIEKQNKKETKFKDREIKPWERQDLEKQVHFTPFEIYMKLGPTRRLLPVSEQTGIPLKKLEVWGYKYRWKERVAAWDAEQERLQEILERNKQVEDIRSVLEQKNQLGDVQFQIAIALYTNLSQAIQNFKPGDINMKNYNSVLRSVTTMATEALANRTDALALNELLESSNLKPSTKKKVASTISQNDNG